MSQNPDNVTSPARRRIMATPIWVRRLKFWFSRENLREFATTLGLVVPLTVLIWIWAEREQTLESDVQLTVDVRSRNPGTIVSLARGDDRTGPASISVKISGPKVGVDSLKAAMSSDSTRSRIALDVGDEVGDDGTRDIPIQPLLDAQNLFRDYGITVRSTDPDTLKVRADPVVTEDIKPTLPTDLATRVDSVITEPATIRVRGSSAAIEKLRRENKLRAELDVAERAELRAKEPGSTVPLDKVAIKSLAAAGVSFETPTVNRATLVFSQARDGELQSVVVNYSIPSALFANVIVAPQTLGTVKISGPPDVLAQLRVVEGDARPYAVVRVTRDDLLSSKGVPFKRKPTFANLPDGVRVVDGPELAVTVTATPVESPR